MQDSIVDTLGIATMLLLQCSHPSTTSILEKEGAKIVVAGAELSGDVDGCVSGWKADQKGESGLVPCAGGESVTGL